MPIKLVECKDWAIPGHPGKVLMYVERKGIKAAGQERLTALVWVKDEGARKARKPAEAL